MTDCTCKWHNGDFLPCKEHYPQGMDLMVTAPENEDYFEELDRENNSDGEE